MVAFILGAVTGALIAWLSFFIVVYPFYKKLATENAMLRDSVESWQIETQYLEGLLQEYEPWTRGEM